MEFNKDLKKRKIFVKREFNAPPDEVWKAWTDSSILDEWWAPRPWKAITKNMDFREGGHWLYAMADPDGSRHYARADYESIVPKKSFTASDSFCDENGTLDSNMPVMHWKCLFEKSGKGTMVNIEISFEKEADIEKIIEMGFREGFTMALTNLDEIFEKVERLKD